jgi:hypothetical protein
MTHVLGDTADSGPQRSLLSTEVKNMSGQKYATRNDWFSELCPLSGILNTNSFYYLEFRTMNEVSKPSNSEVLYTIVRTL